MRGASLAVMVVAIGLAVGALFPGVASANLVVNGGFETGDFTGWMVNLEPDGGFPWTVVSTFDLGPGYPASGTYYATTGCTGGGCLNPPDTGAFLTQVLPTALHQDYELDFAYDPYIGSPTELEVLWNGVTIFDQSTDYTTDPGYITETVANLTTMSTMTTLTFLGRQDESFNGLDDVSVVPTPEPSSGVLLAVVLVGLAGAHAARVVKFFGRTVMPN